MDVVKLLVDNGADFNAKTAGGGGTVLWWAKQTHGEEHPVISFLEELGALEGLQKATVDFDSKKATVIFDKTIQNQDNLTKVVEATADGKTYKVVLPKS